MLCLARKLAKPLLLTTTPKYPLQHILTVRFYASDVLNADPTALQMVNYALDLARSKKSSESYGEAHLVLEQCFSAHIREGDNLTENTKGVVLLAMSTLLSERGDLDKALDKLDEIKDLGKSNSGVRVAAIEGMIGLKLEMEQDVTATKLANKCIELLETDLESSASSQTELYVFKARAKAAKALVDMVLGDIENVGKFFEGTLEDKGNVMLTYAELFHVKGGWRVAKDCYEKVIQGVQEIYSLSDPHSIAACNMVPFEVLLGATCALGQLEAHSGNFTVAEDILTTALTKAEEHFGSHHPKVGVILTCIALMFRYKAKLEHSSSILVQEGLYRRAIDILKAPSGDVKDGEPKVPKGDIVALASGGYAELLCVQENRKTEGERMKLYAATLWRNRRLSLAEALEFSQSSFKVAVVDTRISRAL